MLGRTGRRPTEAVAGPSVTTDEREGPGRCPRPQKRNLGGVVRRLLARKALPVEWRGWVSYNLTAGIDSHPPPQAFQSFRLLFKPRGVRAGSTQGGSGVLPRGSGRTHPSTSCPRGGGGATALKRSLVARLGVIFDPVPDWG